MISNKVHKSLMGGGLRRFSPALPFAAVLLAVSYLPAEQSPEPSPLPAIIRSGDLDALQAHLRRDRASANLPVSDNNTFPLHLCAGFDQDRLAKILLAAGADVNAVNRAGATPLHLAAITPGTNIVGVLVNAGAKINAATFESKTTPLHAAAGHLRYEVIELLMCHGADPLAVDAGTRTPFDILAQEYYRKLARAESDKGAASSERLRLLMIPSLFDAGRSNIAAVIRHSKQDSLRLLLEYDVDFMNHPIPGQAIYPLHLCAFHEQPDMAELLLAAGADPNVATHAGITPLHIAALVDSGNTARILIARNAITGNQNMEGRTPLQMAEWMESAKTARLLQTMDDDKEPGNATEYPPISDESYWDRFFRNYENEVHRHWREFITPYDRNRDGSIDSIHFDAYQEALYARNISERDAAIAGLLLRFDRDNDGQISYGEVRHILHRFQELRELRQIDRQKYGRQRLLFVLQEFDLNGDGVLSHAEKTLAHAFERASAYFDRRPDSATIHLEVNFAEPIRLSEITRRYDTPRQSEAGEL